MMDGRFLLRRELEAPEPEEEDDEPEPMGFDQGVDLTNRKDQTDERPEEPSESLSIGPPKKKGLRRSPGWQFRKCIQHPSKKPRSNCSTSLTDWTSDSRYISINFDSPRWVLIYDCILEFLVFDRAS